MVKTSCYLIASLETNHNGDLSLAKRMIDEAISSGCNAVKITRKNVESFYSEEIRQQPFVDFPEMGTTYGQVLSALELKKNELKEVRDICRGRIDFIAAPYDLSSLQDLSALEPDSYHIDPPVISHTPLLEAVARMGKPVFAAVGMCTDVEIAHLVNLLKGVPLTLLHCVMASPLNLESTALGVITHLKQKYGLPVGYLDNEEGVDSSVAAFALGAHVIEKPFTLDRHLRGPFHAVTAGREELRSLARSMRALEQSLRPVEGRTLMDAEMESFSRQRVSLVVLKDLPAGTTIQRELLGIKAGLNGVSPRLLSEIVGKKTLYDLAEGSPVTFGTVGL